ncbi:hypothetical protein AHAS_Ahas19G0135100 [Arachis hypogaea]
MEFNSSFDQTNFMGYHPPSPIDYSNGDWEYHQENTNSEHSNQWRYATEPQDEQEYFPPPQNDSSHYSNGGWEYHQEMINDEAIHIRYDPEPQDDLCHYPHGNFNALYDTHQETSSLKCDFNKFMQNCPPMPQNEPYCDEFNNSSSCAWENQNQKAFNVSYSINQEPSSLEQTFNSFMQNCQTSPPSFSCENSSSLDYASTQSFLQDPYNSFPQPQNSFHNSRNSLHTP